MAFLVYISIFTLATTLIHGSPETSDTTLRANRPALLKPLTPIAGTNLYLNTVYKWHDRLKPGCYATWFWETYQDWKDKYKGVDMVCNANDQKYYDTADADWIIERTEGADSDTEYAGTVKIRNVGAADTLETWLSAGTWWVGVASYGANPSEDMWNIRSEPGNKNNLQLDIQNWFIAQNPAANHRSYLFVAYNNRGGYPYTFVPAIKLEATMSNFEFTKPIEEELHKRTSQKGLIDAYTINNDSPVTLSRKVTVSEKISNQFSWGFSESFKAFSKVTGKAGIPFVAEGEVEAGFELEVAANQNWQSSVEKTFEMSYDVTVPPNSQVKISAYYDLINGLSMDYTATTEITGKTSRVSVYNDLVQDTTSTGEMIRSHLDYSNFDGKIIEIKTNSVVVQVKGTMVASLGVRGRLNVNGDIVRTKT